MEARLLFEPGMAAMACRRASDQEIDHILSLGAAVEQAALSGQSRLEADRAFHQAIIAASRNVFLSRLLPAINCAATESARMQRAEDMLTEYTLQDHALLMKFLKVRMLMEQDKPWTCTCVGLCCVSICMRRAIPGITPDQQKRAAFAALFLILREWGTPRHPH